MALFRIGSQTDPARIIRAGSIYLRPPELRDYAQWAALRAQSRDFLTPWEPVWPADELTRASFRARIRRQDAEIARDETYPFFVFREEDYALLGGLTLGHVRRGVAQTATLGYWMGEPYAGKGYMSRAVQALARFGFSSLGLHRIEAACLLHNERSIRLLKSCGFQQEGQARAYLKINGSWQDHLLFALLDTDTIPPTSQSHPT